MEGCQDYDDVVPQYEVIADLQLSRSRVARPTDQD